MAENVDANRAALLELDVAEVRRFSKVAVDTAGTKAHDRGPDGDATVSHIIGRASGK